MIFFCQYTNVQRAKRDSDSCWIKKIHHYEINTFHNVCKSKISFTELYESLLYGIFMSACLTLFIYTVRQIADYDLWNGDNVWTLYSISCEVHGITFSHYA